MVQTSKYLYARLLFYSTGTYDKFSDFRLLQFPNIIPTSSSNRLDLLNP